MSSKTSRLNLPQLLPFYNPLDPTYPKLWPDYTLIMPVCAVGNIGQLACDLMISTLLDKHECQLIGRLYSPALMSVVGPNAYSLKGPPTTSTEVYESKKYKLIIIQQRTSYFKILRNIYIEQLVHWIKESKFDRVLVLSSSFAQCNPDISQLGEFSSTATNSVRSITTSLFESTDSRWQSLNLKAVPNKRTSKVIQDGLSYLPGSGITKPLIKAFEKAFIPAAFLIAFCSEGINIQDCYEVANIVDRLINLGYGAHSVDGGGGGGGRKEEGGEGDIREKTAGWIEPFSWTQAQC